MRKKSEQFIPKGEGLVPGGFSDNFEQLEFKLEKQLGYRNLQEKLEKVCFKYMLGFLSQCIIHYLICFTYQFSPIKVSCGEIHDT